MKQIGRMGFLLVVFTLCFPLHGMAQAEGGDQLEVVESALCLDVVDRECVGGNTVFPADVGKIYCWTRIYGAQGDTEITHVWFFADAERARVPLAVRSVNFRTYSSKIIRPMEIGDWRVEVVDGQNRILKIIEFRIE
jgi:hypothetical protein